jgi:hypothetical protein
MTRRSGREVLAVALAVLPACGGGGGPTEPAGPASATITIAATPPSWAAVPCPPSSCGSVTGELEAAGTVAIRETAGLGGNVDSIAVQGRDAGGTVLIQGAFDAAGVRQLAGTNRVAASGSLAVPGVGMHFSPDRRPATIVVTVQLTDDRGNRLGPSLAVPVM